MKRFNRIFLGSDDQVLSLNQRATHTYVIGQSGTGKSRAIESWVMQDVIAGRGVGVIDPHGDLFYNLLLRLAIRPDLWKQIVILNPLDPKWTVGFNPLQDIGSLPQERLALYLTDIGIKIWKLSPSDAPRMVWLLTNTFLALAGLGLTLLDLPRFLMDTEFRENFLPRLPIEAARNFFLYEFPKSEGAIHQWVTPVLNKMGGLIFDPDIRLMFVGDSTVDFRRLIDKKHILLVNLPKGILGESPSALLAAFIVAHLQKAALSRVDTQKRTPFYLYLDEFQNYTTDNIKDILSESRKYALSLTLAHQYLDQLSADLRSAVLNTAGMLVSFRISYNDAIRLAKEIFPSPDYLSNLETRIHFNRFGLMPFPTIRSRQDDLGWSSLALLLSKLEHREFWMRRSGPYLPLKQRTFEMPTRFLNEEMKSRTGELLDFSGNRFGRLKAEARQEYTGRYVYFQNAQRNHRVGNDGSPWSL
ncbi:MAG: hypothetical protein PVF83_11615 [Anaerolineales bacterium]|jgi:hypothetical protein